MGKLEKLVIHCTATPEGREVTGEDIRRMHLSPAPQGRGWRQVGYTDLVRLDGTIERLVENNEDGVVDPWEVTNGARGHNSNSRHIVYAGGCDSSLSPKDTRTLEQKEALKSFVLEFHTNHPMVKIVGHNSLAAKACPSFDVEEWLSEIGIN